MMTPQNIDNVKGEVTVALEDLNLLVASLDSNSDIDYVKDRLESIGYRLGSFDIDYDED